MRRLLLARGFLRGFRGVGRNYWSSSSCRWRRKEGRLLSFRGAIIIINLVVIVKIIIMMERFICRITIILGIFRGVVSIAIGW